MFDDLYNTDILTLSAGLRNERLESPMGTARKVSKLCGSWLEIDLDGAKGEITTCAIRVQACALGQASAAVLKTSIIGARASEIVEARDALKSMLKSGAPAPKGRFEKLGLLSGVSAYPARHTSTLLAFEAAVEALQSIGEF